MCHPCLGCALGFTHQLLGSMIVAPTDEQPRSHGKVCKVLSWGNDVEWDGAVPSFGSQKKQKKTPHIHDRLS